MTTNSSWVKRTITSPFRKAARTFFNHQNHHNNTTTTTTTTRENKSHHHHQGHDDDKRMMDLQLQGEVMACAYEDVQVMWSILDKSKPRICNVNS